MNLFDLGRAVLAAAVLAAACFAAPALAVTNGGGTTFSPYVAAFTPEFGPSGVPYVGRMQLVVRDGTIDGTYTGISARPDFLTNRISQVTGTVNSGDGYVQLNVGNALAFRGTMDADGTISGTATYRGRLYEFVAKPGSPARR
ncbi:MAG: hypothetical protein WB681_08185 [Candidatus Cybelea sp.]